MVVDGFCATVVDVVDVVEVEVVDEVEVVVELAGVCVTVTVWVTESSSRVSHPGPVAETVHVPFAMAVIVPDDEIEHTPDVDEA